MVAGEKKTSRRIDTTIQIFVQTAAGNTMGAHIGHEEFVGAVKQMFLRRIECSSGDACVTLDGRVSSEREVVKNCGFVSGSIVFVSAEEPTRARSNPNTS